MPHGIDFSFEICCRINPPCGILHISLSCCRALDADSRVPELKKRVEAFAGGFQMPGFDVKSIDHSTPGKGIANGIGDHDMKKLETDDQDHSNMAINPTPN